MADVFLSYNQTDRPIAQAIAAELQRLGVDVWWDHDLLGGDDFRARIAEVLTRSIVTLLFGRVARLIANGSLEKPPRRGNAKLSYLSHWMERPRLSIFDRYTQSTS
jgi:hypothetical protein